MGLVDRTPRRLFVTEAAIDALSLKSLMLIHGIDDSDCAYLACGGTASNALLYHIKHHPQIQKIYLCMDNDEAGHTARKNFRSELKTVGFSGKVIDKIPIGKDFNVQGTSDCDCNQRAMYRTSCICQLLASAFGIHGWIREGESAICWKTLY